MPRIESLCTNHVGQTICGLLVLQECGRSRDGHVLYKCRCTECGNISTKYSNQLTCKTSGCKYCAPKRISEKLKKHGQHRTRLYKIWLGMKARCKNTPGQTKKHDYFNYYKRGIRVCEEWDVFENFFAWAINNGYKNNLSIDRINNDGNYCPENCRWVTKQQQAENKRNSILVAFNDKLLTPKELSKILGVKRQNLYRKIHRGEYGKIYIGGRLSAKK